MEYVTRHALSYRAYPLPYHGLDEMFQLRRMFEQLAMTGARLPPVSASGEENGIN
jgi:hypothetical protein